MKPRIFNDYGRNIKTGEKRLLRVEWEKLAGTDNPDLTDDQLIQIINNRNDEHYRKMFHKALNDIEDSLTPANLEKIKEMHHELKDYPPLIKAIKLKEEYFKNLI